MHVARIVVAGLLLGSSVAAQDAAEQAAARLDAGDVAGAIVLLDAAIAANAGDASLWSLRAECHRRNGELERAAADCDRALAILLPESKLLAIVGDSPIGRELFDTLRLRGDVRGKLGAWLRALDDLRKATAVVATDAEAWRERAYAEHNVGRLDDAVASLGKAVDAGGERQAMYLQMRAAMQQRRGDVAAARADLERALALAPAGPPRAAVHLELGILATAAGDLDAARAEFDRVAAAHAGLAPWAALMRWCNTPVGELDAATARLRADFAKAAADPLAQELCELCCTGAGDTGGMPLADRDTTARCPLWFFAGVRAALQRRDADALVRFRRCVNTGRLDYAQWRAAFARVQAAAGKRPLQPSLGMAIVPATQGKQPILRVTAVAPDGAAAIQGLQVDDIVTMVNTEPATKGAFDAMAKSIVIGTPVRFVVQRGGAAQELRVTAGIATP